MHETANKVGHNRNKSTRYEIFRQEIQENTKTMDAFYNLNCTSGGDARYAIIAIQHLEQSGKTLFQATTQMTCTMCENVTSKEKIFQMFCEYKLFNKKRGPVKKRGEWYLSRPPRLHRQPSCRCEHRKRKKRWARECIREIQTDPTLLLFHISQRKETGPSQQENLKKQGRILRTWGISFKSQRKQTSKTMFSASMLPGRMKANR